MKRLLAALLVFLYAAIAGAADGLVALPPLKARVTDLTGTLGAAQQQRLDAYLAQEEARKGAQVVVLMLPTTKPETIEQFGIRLAEAWKVGRKGIDDGVIVVVAKDDRRARIEVGYGLEGALNDATAKRIVSDTMTPHFKRGDYFGGLQAGTQAIVGVIEGESLPAPGAAPGSFHGGNEPADDGWVVWLIAALVFASVAHRLLGIVGSFGAAGVAGFVGFSMFGGWLAAIAAGLIAFLLSFVPLSLLLQSAGMFGGRGWDSRGSGGFGGRGGGFGGGGASGSW